jgi:hypothetical protein
MFSLNLVHVKPTGGLECHLQIFHFFRCDLVLGMVAIKKFVKFFQAIADLNEENKTLLEICVKRLLKDISIVEIYFGSPFIKKYKRNVQTTLTGKISNIGMNLI